MSSAEHPLLPPVLAGRADELARADELIAARPGAIALTGPPGSGRSRLAREIATRLGGDGVRVIAVPDDGGDAPARLAGALTALGLPADPRAAGARTAFVALAGETSAEDRGADAVAISLAGSRSLALFWGESSPPEIPAIPLGPLGDDEAARLVHGSGSDISPALEDRILALGRGRPGLLVALARAAHGTEEFAPLIAPDAAPPTPDVGPALDEVLVWASHLGPAFPAAELAQLTGRSTRALEDDLDALDAAGVLTLGPGAPALWTFTDPLVAEALLSAMGPARLRRDSATALRAGHACGRDARDLVARAARAVDAAEVVRLSAAASDEARVAGQASLALRHAERALEWHDDELPERLLLDGLAARGRARSALSDWEAAARDLHDAAEGYGACGEGEKRLAASSGSASADWMLGRHDAAFRRLSASLSEDVEPQTPSPGRAESLADAAGMALATGRVIDAGDLSERARSVARACGEAAVASRSLVVATTARVLAGGRGDALPDFRRAAEEASADGNSRIVTLAAIHHSHALSLLGRPEDAADEARAGAARAEQLGLSDHHLVLLGNLGEALVECGRLADADDALGEAAAGWRELGREAPSPVDPARARLLLARGLISDALREYRSIRVSLGKDPLFEQLAPAAAGHALAAATAGETREAERVITRCLAAWQRSDDRLAIVPLLVAGAMIGSSGAPQTRCLQALNTLAAEGVESARLFAVGDAITAPGLRRAADRLAAAGLEWWTYRLRFVAGGISDDEEAIEDLHLARREFRQMGADGWRLRSEAALRARGQRIPSRAEGRPTEANALSAREMEVLAHLSQGLRNREIGDELFIAERTVARHVGKILAKLEVPTRTAAVRVARERGLLPETIV